MFGAGRGIVPYWFLGVVVDKDDPTNNGRVRIRAIGVHPEDPQVPVVLGDKEELDYVEDSDLPWAWVINGTFGKMQCVPDEGEWVFGFFADGRDAQHPMILGSIAGSNTDDFGFGTQPSDEAPDQRPDNTFDNTNNPGSDSITPPDPNAVSTGYEQSGLTQAQVEDMIREEAALRGINPNTAIEVARSEGVYGYQSTARRPDGSRERSYGPYQLFVDGGLGTEFQRQTGIDIANDRSAASIRRQIQFSLDYAASNGWGPNNTWYGAGRVGITNREGLAGASPVNNWREGQV
jgi:hypothetical protein